MNMDRWNALVDANEARPLTLTLDQRNAIGDAAQHISDLSARIATLTAAAELAFAHIDAEIDGYAYDEILPPALNEVYRALYDALDKAPALEIAPDYTDPPY